mgnify:FL=1
MCDSALTVIGDVMQWDVIAAPKADFTVECQSHSCLCLAQTYKRILLLPSVRPQTVANACVFNMQSYMNINHKFCGCFNYFSE